jgi:structure-specific recognition protein 1
LAFSVGNKSAFEVPLTEVANSSVASKNEVMVEFAPPEFKGTDGRPVRIKEDILVEMRFFVPGLATAGRVADEGGAARFKDTSELSEGASGSISVSQSKEDGEVNAEDEEFVVGEDGEALSAAAVFCETIKQKADIGSIQTEAIVRFEELLCLTPRYVPMLYQ